MIRPLSVKCSNDRPRAAILAWGKIAAFLIALCLLKVWINAFVLDHWTKYPQLGLCLGDLQPWYDFSRQCLSGLIPYIDFSREYSTGAGLFYWVLAKLFHYASDDQFVRVHFFVMALVDVVNAGLLYYLLGLLRARRRLFWVTLFALAPTALLLSPMRFEACVSFWVLAGLVFCARGMPLGGIFCWAVAGNIKWYPFFFIAAFLADHLRRCGGPAGAVRFALKSIVVCLGVTAVFNLPFIAGGLLAHGTIRMWTGSFLYHLQRACAFDTFFGVWSMWLGYPPAEQAAGYITFAAMVLLAFYPRSFRWETRCVLVVLAGLFLNRIYSPQFNLWYYPFLFVVSGRLDDGRLFRRCIIFLLLEIANVLVYPCGFYYITKYFMPLSLTHHPTGWGTLLLSIAVIVRMQCLVFLGADLVAAERADRRNSPGKPLPVTGPGSFYLKTVVWGSLILLTLFGAVIVQCWSFQNCPKNTVPLSGF